MSKLVLPAHLAQIDNCRTPLFIAYCDDQPINKGYSTVSLFENSAWCHEDPVALNCTTHSSIILYLDPLKCWIEKHLDQYTKSGN